MRLLIFDLLMWLNVFAYVVVFWNRKCRGNLQWLSWGLTIFCGGIGTWLALIWVDMREKNPQKYIALGFGLVQLALMQDLLSEFLLKDLL